MLKKILNSFVVFFSLASLSFASETCVCVLDTPTASVMTYGSYDVGFGFFSAGSVVSKINFGVSNLFNVGVLWELDKLVGVGKLRVSIPALHVKFRIYGGNMTLPALTLGYEGHSYFFNSSAEQQTGEANAVCEDGGGGLYFVAGREIFIEDLMLNLGININGFRNSSKLCGFVNAVIPLYKEAVYLMAECRNINPSLALKVSFGVRFVLKENISLDYIVRDCMFKRERVFGITYYAKF
jgi:hypothetical protein